MKLEKYDLNKKEYIITQYKEEQNEIKEYEKKQVSKNISQFFKLFMRVLIILIISGLAGWGYLSMVIDKIDHSPAGFIWVFCVISAITFFLVTITNWDD